MESCCYYKCRISCSPDPATNYETTYLNFHGSFDQLGQVLQALSIFFCFSKKFQKLVDKTGFVVSKLVVRFGEQNTYWKQLKLYHLVNKRNNICAWD